MPTTFDLIAPLRPCQEALAWAAEHPDPVEAWATCPRGDWMIWLLRRRGAGTRGQWVRVAVGMARSVLHHVRPGEERPRLAIEAAEAWLASPCEETRAAADAAAYAAYAAYAAAEAAAEADAEADAAAAAAAAAAAVRAVFPANPFAEETP